MSNIFFFLIDFRSGSGGVSGCKTEIGQIHFGSVGMMGEYTTRALSCASKF